MGRQQSRREKVFVKTYGCQMNVYDSERMADVLAPLGYQPTGRRKMPTCAAQHLPYPREGGGEGLFRARPLRELKDAAAPTAASMTIGVAGCVAQAEGEEILRRARPSISSSARRPITACPNCCARARRAASSRPTLPAGGQVRRICPPKPADPRARHHGLPHRAGRLRQVLHLLRGALYARRRSLAPGRADRRRGRSASPAKGVREITLLGQNVNAYHGEGRTGRTGGSAT
jgi:tRNA-2-methylthio-N6-dimethylallyladenosine synthase